MFWLPCLLPFALIYKVLEYIYRYFVPKVEEEEKAPACPVSGKATEDGASCPFVATPAKTVEEGTTEKQEEKLEEKHEKVAWLSYISHTIKFWCTAALVSDVL